jgi:hypothetical protein
MKNITLAMDEEILLLSREYALKDIICLLMHW